MEPVSPVLVEDRSRRLAVTGMRVHELALLRFLNHAFYVEEGYPVPVVFANPSDAAHEFHRQWGAGDNNPFAYLIDLKDKEGKPLYQPYPSNIRYPLISVQRQSVRYRPQQSYGPHRNRRVFWASTSGTLSRDDLALVGQNYYPSAWDYRFQITHYAKEPQTQALFQHRLQRAFFSGAVPQTFLVARYPFPHGHQYLRTYIEGDIDPTTEVSDDTHQEYRTSFSLVIEGYSVDYEFRLFNALWELTIAKESASVNPAHIDEFFDAHEAFPAGYTIDTREGENNPTLIGRNLPNNTPVILP